MNRYKFIDEKKSHLHTLDQKPLIGTSTVTNIISKNLTWWAAELAAVEALETDNFIPTIREEYLAAKKLGKPGIDALQKKYPIFKASRFAHYDSKNEAADSGVDMHAELEAYVKYCITNNEGKPIDAYLGSPQVKIFRDWSVNNVRKFISSEGHCYSERLWTGGIIDLVYEDMSGNLVIMDFKSSKEAYPNHFIQIAGYAIEAEENGILDAEGNLVYKVDRLIAYYSVFPFGAENPEPQIRNDTIGLKAGFEAALTLHRLINV